MSDPRRRLPSVDALLADDAVAALTSRHPRALVVRAIRAALDAARADGGAPPAEGWAQAVESRVNRLAAPSLVPVINATGVVLHTNLGRALLAPVAVQAMTAVAQSYASVEYDLGRGSRGSRHAICRDVLVELTGAEDALVVNNAAAGLLLALSALARDGEAIVSRGEPLHPACHRLCPPLGRECAAIGARGIQRRANGAHDERARVAGRQGGDGVVGQQSIDRREPAAGIAHGRRGGRFGAARRRSESAAAFAESAGEGGGLGLGTTRTV